MEVIIFLCILGALGTISGISILRKGANIRKWDRLPAKVTKKEVKHSPNKQGATRTSQYEVGIEYEYTIDDKPYKSDVYMNVNAMMNESAAQKKVDNIPDEIMVYVNPESHEEAFYKVTSKRLGAIALITGVCCLLGLLISLL